MLQEQLGKQDVPSQQADVQFRTPLANSMQNIKVASTPSSLREEQNSESSPNTVRSPVASAKPSYREGTYSATKPSSASLTSLHLDQVAKHKTAECFAL